MSGPTGDEYLPPRPDHSLSPLEPEYPLYPATQVFPTGQPYALGPAYQPTQSYPVNPAYPVGPPPSYPPPQYSSPYPQYPGYPPYPYGYGTGYGAPPPGYPPRPPGPVPPAARPPRFSSSAVIISAAIVVAALIVGVVLIATHHDSSTPSASNVGPSSGLSGFPSSPGSAGASGSSGASDAPSCTALSQLNVLSNEVQIGPGGTAPTNVPVPNGDVVTACVGEFTDGSEEAVTVIAYSGATANAYDQVLTDAGWVGSDDGLVAIYDDDGTSGYEIDVFTDSDLLIVVYDQTG